MPWFMHWNFSWFNLSTHTMDHTEKTLPTRDQMILHLHYCTDCWRLASEPCNFISWRDSSAGQISQGHHIVTLVLVCLSYRRTRDHPTFSSSSKQSKAQICIGNFSIFQAISCRAYQALAVLNLPPYLRSVWSAVEIRPSLFLLSQKQQLHMADETLMTTVG